MVSSSPHKKDVAANSSLNKRAITLVSGPKPLVKHRFYLDIKNHITSSKLETKIKQLGGNLEVFLDKEVTHIITDREGWSTCNKGGGTNPETPRTPVNQSSVYNDHGTSEITPKRGRPKTRVDAMLEKARRASTVAVKDPLVQGKSWGIAIWSIEKVNNWLEKVQLKTETKKLKPKVKELTSPYIKFEAFDRKHRPVFSEIRSWSILNIKGDVGSSGLTHERVDRNMTRKSRAPNPPRVEPVEPLGYCEVCRVQYIELDDHLKSKEHIAFGKDNSNFIELDNLINDGTNLAALINTMKSDERKLNGVNGRHRSPVMAKIVRRRANSICKIDKVLLNSVEKELKAKRKSRGKTSSQYTDDSADEGSTVIDLEDSLPIRELRSSYRKALKKIAEQESNTWNSGRPKRACINKQKRISVDNNVISENKGYYKIEKPKSSPTPPIKVQEEVPVKKKAHSENKDEKPLVFKFKKMRWSELKQLNNEAVNFLFPHKEESSSEDDIDANAPNTTVSTQHDESSIVISSDNENEKHDDEQSMDSISSESSQVKKKRRTQAEKFIWDNMKYYKFETPESRLRYHGSLMPEVVKPTKNNGEVSQNVKKEVVPETKPEPEEPSAKKAFNLNNIKFAFEIIPKSEPWYQTFSRQDNGEEYYTCYSDSGCWKPRLLLPYEMGPLPPLNPETCISHYKQIKQQIIDEFKSSSCSASCSTPDGGSNDSCAEDTKRLANNIDASEDSMDEEPKTVIKVPKKRGRKPKGSRPPLPPGKNPRKSPRQHASTLAILGNLMQRKRSRGRPPLEPIPEADTSIKEATNTKKLQQDNEALAKSIDDMLNDAVREVIDSEPLDIPVDDDINLRLRVSVVDILEDYESFIQSDDKSKMVECKKRGASPGKKVGRKRKKNRTGWPNKNNRKSVKKEHNNTEEVKVKLNGDDKISNKVEDSVQDSVEISVNNDDQDQSTNNCVNKTNSEIIEIDDRVKVSDVRNSDCVVDLDRWENAEKILAAKMNDINNDLLFQPYVRVQKLDDNGIKNANKRLRESSSPHRTNKKARRMPGSPKSPRVLRKPRGRWYRER